MAYYKTVRTVDMNRNPVRLKRCGMPSCGRDNRWSRRNCHGCGHPLERRPQKERPRRGTVERMQHDLRGAQRAVQEWTSRVINDARVLDRWRRRAKYYEDRIAAGPQPKRERPKPKLRGIRLPKPEQPS